MPKVNIKKARPKSYEENLRERQERMAMVDRPEVVFMPGEDLSDNDDDDRDAPLEISTKREVLPLVEGPLPEIQLKQIKKKKKARVVKSDDGEYSVKVENTVQFKIKTLVKKERPIRNKLSFRERLLLLQKKTYSKS